MSIRAILAYLVLAPAVPLASGCASVAGDPARHVEPARATAADPTAGEPVGWYELAPGHDVLVTWAPEAGELRLLDFDSVRFHALRPAPNSVYLWKPADGLPERRVSFTRDGGRVTALHWRDEAGAGDVAPRAREFPFDQRRVVFQSADSTRLEGLLMIPRVRKYVGPSPGRMRQVPVMLPAAVIIHGSGASDRDNVWAFHIAQHLARNGVVVLLPDKRGSGASGGDWRSADFADLAEDALAGVDLLRRQREVDPDRVGLVGLSQGGWVAPLAAGADPAIAFVIDVSGAAVTPARQVRHEITQDLRSDDFPEPHIAQIMDLIRLADAYARTLSPPAWEAYSARRSAMANGPLAAAVEPLPASRDHWRWAWWNRVMDFDPMPLWRSLDRPALIVYGGKDESDNVPVEESVRKLRDALRPERHPDRDIRVFPESGHALTDDSGWIDPSFLDLLSSWIREHLGEERDRAQNR